MYRRFLPSKKLGERASLHRLQVLLTLSTKSNYAWIHLNITTAFHDIDFPCSLRYHHASPTSIKKTIGTVMAAMVADEILASAFDETV